ncbi:hypothetical protein V8C86DRAFT_3030385 [Haematococcus lacustris]
MPAIEYRGVLATHGIKYPSGWEDEPRPADIMTAIHSRRLNHSLHTRSLGRARIVNVLLDGVSHGAKLDAGLDDGVVEWDRENNYFPRMDGLARSRLEEEHADVGQPLWRVPSDSHPNPCSPGTCGGDDAFDVTSRLLHARKLVVEMERDVNMLPVDLTVAVCMRDLYEEMSVFGPQVPQKAGLLLEAVLAAIRSRREMMLKEVVKAYTGAWVDNDLQSVNRDPIVLKAWLDWAVQHDTVGTPESRRQLRDAMGAPPPPRQLVYDLMVRIAQRAVVGEDQVVGRLMDQQREHNQRVAQQSDAAVAREWAARHNLLDTVESILANCATSVKAVMDVIAADMNIPPPAFAVRRAGASTGSDGGSMAASAVTGDNNPHAQPFNLQGFRTTPTPAGPPLTSPRMQGGQGNYCTCFTVLLLMISLCQMFVSSPPAMQGGHAVGLSQGRHVVTNVPRQPVGAPGVLFDEEVWDVSSPGSLNLSA